MSGKPTGLPPHVEREFNKLEQKQSLEIMVWMVDQCFRDCVGSFKSRVLETKEERCLNICADKVSLFMPRAMRVGQEQMLMGQMNDSEVKAALENDADPKAFKS